MSRLLRDLQDLDPEIIFQFNARLDAAWRENRLERVSLPGGKPEDVYPLPLLFRKATQTYQWLGVARVMWQWATNEALQHYSALFNELLPEIGTWQAEVRRARTGSTLPQTKWGRFRKDLLDPGILSDQEAIRTIEYAASRPADDLSPQLKRALLVAYSGYHHAASDRNLEGWLFRVISARRENGEHDPRACLLEGEASYPKEGPEGGLLRWVTHKSPYPESLRDKVVDLQTLEVHDSIPQLSDVNRVQLDLSARQDGYSIAEVFNRHLLIEPQRIGQKGGLHVLLIPAWDVWLPSPPPRPDLPRKALCGAGSITGVLALNFASEKLRTTWLKRHYVALTKVLRDLSHDAASAALTRASGSSMESGQDLVRHFLWTLRHVQGWEAGAVFRHDGELVDGFFRRPFEDAPAKSYMHWAETLPTDLSKEARKNLSREERGQHERLREMWNCVAAGPRLIRGTNGTPSFLVWHPALWNQVLIPDLRPAEVTQYGDLAMVFQFPDHAHLPSCAYRPGTCDDDLQTVADHYLRQQLELMRRLLPKVRARNSALKSAVASIMGRNMSHNIGSHVLARYSGRVRSDLVQAPVEQSGPLDHREDFLRYLQRRMDFIAEVATSERSLWSQPLGLRSVLERLDFDRQVKLLNDGGRRTHQPILLSYVAGKDGPTGPVRATVEIDTPTPTEWHFNCPGGEVGAHALYVILENIIRNSARHNSGSLPDRIALKIKVTEACFQHADDGNDEYWRVTVVDERSMRPTDSTDEDLVARINRLLQSTPVLTPDGALDPHYWGVREMQICAAYLRGVPLSDLEGRPRRPPLVTAAWTEGGRLSYELHVQRARLAVFVTRSPLAATVLPPGVRPATVANGTPLSSACVAARGYAFAIVEAESSGAAGPSQGYAEDADWPVRTFFKTREEIDELLRALRGAGDVITWLDQRLHRETAIQYRMLRTAWRSVAEAPRETDVLVLRGGGALAEDSALATDAADTDSAATHLMKANTTSWATWQRTHGSNANRLRLAWIDHPTHDLLAGPRGFTDALSDTGERLPRFEFAEGVRSASPHRDAIAALRAGIEPFNELAAAALGRVIVLDERVQGEADKDSPASGLKYRHYWPYWGAWIPRREDADLNAPDLERIKAFLNAPRVAHQSVDGREAMREVPTRQLPADFLVVHLTILESLMQHTSLPPAELIRQLRACRAIGPCCRLVVVTGRGVPTLAARACDDGVEGCRYLPISSVFEYLVHNPSKLMLMRALWSAASGSAREGVS